MSELNDAQERLAKTLEGFIVVDAGPGTGKTKTIVDRYVNIVLQEDVRPSDVLLMTFTRNAAGEMEKRIEDRMIGLESDPGSGLYGEKYSRLVRVQTFDSFCLSVVSDYPDEAGSMFGLRERLTRSVGLETNETLNRRRFFTFLDGFIESNPGRYAPWDAIAVEHKADLYELIQRLLARGIYPFRSGGWIGGDNGSELYGDSATLAKLMHCMNEMSGKQRSSAMHKVVEKASLDPNSYAPVPASFDPSGQTLPGETIEAAACEDRTDLIGFVHDVFIAYVEDSIRSDRITFGIAAMLAFSVLYSSREARERNSFRYLMVDEFQDTNAAQIMMSLMILSEPNLCAVGDWKQGIYGFRFVSIEYILDFEKRILDLRRQLNDDGIRRVRFGVPETLRIAFERNYRSSQTVVDHAFRAMHLPAVDKEAVAYDDGAIVPLVSHKDRYLRDSTGVRFAQADTKEKEPDLVERIIRDYMASGFEVVDVRREDDGTEIAESRPVRLGDIAVLCRTSRGCRAVVDRLEADGVPVYLQGDAEVMATREGKLALAWLRYVSNDRDPRGIGAILADLGFTLEDCKRATRDPSTVPDAVREQRMVLRRKRRRVNELLTSIYRWYGIDNDASQAVINVLSRMHSGSLLTISDLISVMEDDMAMDGTRRAVYPVENSSGSDAVRVMTMHKAKGLEFPVVIIPFLDSKVMPLSVPDTSVFTFSPLQGIRCSLTIGVFDGYRKICTSWKTAMVRKATEAIRQKDAHDEERRLMFVAMSRAKQYESLICGPEPSRFMTGLCDGGFETAADIGWSRLPESGGCSSERPDLTGYRPRRPALAVHDLMDLHFDGERDPDADEISAEGRGKEHGTRIHQEAERMLVSPAGPPSDCPECIWIAENVLSRICEPWPSGTDTEGFINSYSELGCTLPLHDPDAVIRGIIDLLIVFRDHVEIHDYKTDGNRDNEDEYRLQLSVYAQVAKRQWRDLPVRCFIDYTYLRRIVEFDPLPVEEIQERARAALERLSRTSEQEDPDIAGDWGDE